MHINQFHQGPQCSKKGCWPCENLPLAFSVTTEHQSTGAGSHLPLLHPCRGTPEAVHPQLSGHGHGLSTEQSSCNRAAAATQLGDCLRPLLANRVRDHVFCILACCSQQDCPCLGTSSSVSVRWILCQYITPVTGVLCVDQLLQRGCRVSIPHLCVPCSAKVDSLGFVGADAGRFLRALDIPAACMRRLAGCACYSRHGCT